MSRLTVSTIFAVLGVAFCLAGHVQTVSGQSDTSVSTGPSPATAVSVQELQQNFDRAIDELRTALKAIKKAGADYYQNKSSEAFEHRERWEAEAANCETCHRNVQKAAFELFFATDNPDAELIQVVEFMNQKLIEQGQLTTCYKATKMLLKLNPDDVELTTIMGQVSVMTNDFETGLAFYQKQKLQAESFGIPASVLYDSIDLLSTNYKREMELRKLDAQGEELPHAIVKTTKGTIVIELFENQAPETVGNFVYLVETGFYEKIIFHHVIRNILVDSGKMTMNRNQPVGYTIYDESKRPDARHHFRGTVSMFINRDEENSGAAEFSFLLVPGPNMNGRNTVFGRVISGMEVLESIQETFMINEEKGTEEFIPDVMPDTIESITVKRLRNHEYEPNRVKEK